MTDQIRIAKINAQAQRELKMVELLRELATNPIVELVGGIALISYLNKGDKSWLQSVTGIDLKADGEYAGLVAIIGLQQIAPLVPSIVAGAGPAAGAVAKLLPAIAAL